MYTYSREELLALYNNDVIPSRPVRKAIFSHCLWLPAKVRQTLKRRIGRQGFPVSTVYQQSSADDCRNDVTAARQRSPPLKALKFGLINARSIGNKFTTVASTITDGHYDVFLVTETWHSSSTDVALRRCAPPGFSYVDKPRPQNDTATVTNHGGVAALISDVLTHRPVNIPFVPTTFESTCFSVSTVSTTVVILLLYRPGSVTITDLFFTELSKYLEVLALYKCQIIVAGDFNIKTERNNDPNAIRLHDMLSSFDCTQHVPQTPTHRDGGTLDLVITKSEQIVEDLVIDPFDIISDHSVISWKLPIFMQPPLTRQRQVRSWNKIDKEAFRAALLRSELCDPEARPTTADEFFAVYQRVLQSMADQHAPVRKVTVRCQRLAVWMDSECRRLRRLSRVFERRYRRTGSSDDRRAWVDHEHERHRIYREKESAYWSSVVLSQSDQPRKLWRSLNAIMGKKAQESSSTRPSAQQLLDFFNGKVAAVRQATGGYEPTTFLPPATETFDKFELYSADEIKSIILNAPLKSCQLDPLPTHVLKEFLPELLPFITDMCNASLQQGVLPLSQRHAVVIPRLKKEGADQMDVKNYRPISNLTFMSKVVERLVCRQLVSYLDLHNLLPNLQSAYRRFRSTETAVLKLITDILQAVDRGEVTLLCLLDLSAAFDTVDHQILLNRLRQSYGLCESVLTWIESFITNRSVSVVLDGQSSTTSSLVCGVPQGSVLGPVLFLLYTADVLVIAERHGLQAHSYADDTQLYSHQAASDHCDGLKIAACITELHQWMSSNRLRLNTDKTQFIWLGSASLLAKLDSQDVVIGDVRISPSTEVTCLGVLLDREVTLTAHIKRLTSRCFYYLRQLRSVRQFLSMGAAKALMHAFVLCRLDYCNSVLHDVPDVHLRSLQSVLNAAARLVSKKRKFDHITAVIRDDLHWLPIRQRIQYKLCMFVYKCLHQAAPSYISEFCVPLLDVPGRRHLRSATHGDLAVPRYRTIRYGRRSFPVSGPTLWNQLSTDTRDPSLTLTQFSSRLKTEIFRRLS